jgi:predicted dehydrogenase
VVGAESLGGQMLVTRGRAAVDRHTFLEQRFGQAYRAQLEAFLECAKHDRPPAVSGKDALAAARIAWAATQALRTGQPVQLEALAHA